MNKEINFKSIRLVFPDVSQLWAFSRNLKCQNLEINTCSKALICSCTDDEIEKAIAHYGARKDAEVAVKRHQYDGNDLERYR